MANPEGQSELAGRFASALAEVYPPSAAPPNRTDILSALTETGLMLAKPHGNNPAEIALTDWKRRTGQ